MARELKEPFLINPKRRKHHGKSKRHRPVAFSEGGHWFTSSRAKKVRKHIRLNPFGGGLMAVNRRNRRRHRRHVSVNRRRHSRNPELGAMVSNLGGLDIRHGIEPAAVIGMSVLIGNLAPAFVQARGYMAIDATWKKYGIQIGTGVAGVMGLRAMGKHEWAKYWGIGSLVTVAIDLLGQYVMPSIQSAIMPVVSTVPVAALTTAPAGSGAAGFGAYPREVRGVGRVGAFPGSVSRMQSPYDRATIYPY